MPLERFRNVLSIGTAVTMSFTITFLSENDVQGETTMEFKLRTFQRRPLKFDLGSAADR